MYVVVYRFAFMDIYNAFWMEELPLIITQL